MSTSSNPDYGVQPSAAAGGVSLLDKTIFHASSASMRTAGLVFQTDGTVSWRRTFTFVQLNALTDWIIPNEDASSAYEIRLTNLNWIIKDEGFAVTPSSTIETDAATLQLVDGGAGMDTIIRTGGSSNFIAEGFTAGSKIQMDRTINSSNSREFEIDAGGVAATVLTLGNTGIDPLIDETGSQITLQSGGWRSSTLIPSGGDPDGDEDVWFDLGTRREWTFVDADSITTTGIQHAQFDFQIRKGSTILVTAAMDWYVDSITGGGGGGGGGGGCFMYGTKFQMADGSLKEIQDIVIGDVMKEGGRVKATQIGDGTREQWFDIDGVTATGSHAVCKDGIWMRVAASGFNQVKGADMYYVLANVNHRMLAENGYCFSDYQEADYTSSGWDDWVIGYLNGDTSVDVLREAIVSTGVDTKIAQDFLNKEGLYEEDYNDKKERLLQELFELEEWKKESVLARAKKGS